MACESCFILCLRAAPRQVPRSGARVLRIGIVGRDLILETRSPEDAEEERVQPVDVQERGTEVGGRYSDDEDGG